MSSFFSGGSNSTGGGYPAAEGSKSPGSERSSHAHSEGSGSRLSFFKFGRKDGEQKKRGPKPDQRPPQNERQARNRQAQRTHRERKERYIKTLEEEILRLREAFTLVTKEKTLVSEENKRLKGLLLAYGIDESNFPLDASLQIQSKPNPRGGSGGSGSGAIGSGGDGTGDGREVLNPVEIAQRFIVALETVCIEHIQVLAKNAAQSSDVVSGHALMATCPPEAHSLHHSNEDWGHKTADLPPEDLAILYNLQTQEMQRQQYLQIFDGELSPIAAWTLITNHPRFKDLNLQDFEFLTDVLSKKASCQGFGAVIEEFEVQDALTAVFAKKNNVVFS